MQNKLNMVFNGMYINWYYDSGYHSYFLVYHNIYFRVIIIDMTLNSNTTYFDL